MDIRHILPNTDRYLQYLEIISNRTTKGFPCACQESSIILYIWLRTNGVKCKIILGDYNDPGLGRDSWHYWIESKEDIIDGSAIQFQLPNYDRLYTYNDLLMITDISNCNMIYDKNDNNYRNKVDSFIPIGRLMSSPVQKALMRGETKC